jgi:hypothetical protein
VVRAATVRGVNHASPAVLGLVIAALVAVILLILVGAYWDSFKAFSPRDRAAGNHALRATADLLGARFRDRLEHPWYARPHQYGTVVGQLDGLGYELRLLLRNTEDWGGQVMLTIRAPKGARLPGGRRDLRAVTPQEVWHWPDQADPGTLASYVREAIAAVGSGGKPPGAL